jgi:phospholipase C
MTRRSTTSETVRGRTRDWLLVAIIAGLSACAGPGTSFKTPMSSADIVAPFPIKHVVIIYQENRTPDNLFQGVPGADISKTAVDSQGQIITLHRVSLASKYNLCHTHHCFDRDFDGGKMDGFDKGLPKNEHLDPFGYAARSDVKPYYDMATQYVFADHMFQSDQGPSFPSHLYIISGTAGDDALTPYLVSSNPFNGPKQHPDSGGCDSRKRVIVSTLSRSTGSRGPRPFPCFDRAVLSDFLDAKHVSWRYYEERLGSGRWHPFDAIRHVRYGPDYANVVTPPQTILRDIANGHLAGLSWVTPRAAWSDHTGPGSTTKGPSWVAAIVNAIGESRYWQTTAILVTWDDWGGWYDHVAPRIFNHYELGCRVPLLVISPYAKHEYVSKEQHEFGSILAFSEVTFGIPKGSLKTTDRRADDLMDAFDFHQRPRKFVPIPAPPFRPSTTDALTPADDP